MKAIDELVTYFTARGALDDEQLRALARMGFYHGPLAADATEDPRDDEDRGDEARDDAAPPKARRGRRGEAPDPRDLAHRVAAAAATWDPALRALAPLAGLDGGWREAARALVDASPDERLTRVASALSTRRVDGASLDDLVGFDGFAEVLAEERRGALAAAWAHLLRADTPGELGRHTSLLRDPDLAAAHTLARALRVAREAIVTLAEASPERLSPHLAHPRADTLYWWVVSTANLRAPTFVRGRSTPARVAPDDPRRVRRAVLASAPREGIAWVVGQALLDDPEAWGERVDATFRAVWEALPEHDRRLLDALLSGWHHRSEAGASAAADALLGAAPGAAAGALRALRVACEAMPRAHTLWTTEAAWRLWMAFIPVAFAARAEGFAGTARAWRAVLHARGPGFPWWGRAAWDERLSDALRAAPGDTTLARGLGLRDDPGPR